MTCDYCQRWLHGYVDNELDTATATQIAWHLQECRECAERYKSLVALRANLKNPALFFAAPAGLKEFVGEAVQAEADKEHRSALAQGAQRIVHGMRSWFVPLISAAMLTAAAIFYVSAPTTELRLADDAVSSHVRSLLADHLTDIASSDQHTVKPWFSGKIDFAPLVEDLAAQGYPLIGGRLEYLGYKPAAALVYRHDKHIINVFVLPTMKVDAGISQDSIRGYNVIAWQRDRLEYVAVSDLNSAALEHFATLLRESR
jgi:anti-sigma factor RsiW